MKYQDVKNILNEKFYLLSDVDKRFYLDNFCKEGICHPSPFGEIEGIMTYFVSCGVISIEEYLNLKNQYISDNKYLYLYGMGNTAFGTHWAENHLRGLDDRIKKAKGKSRDYDLMIELKKEKIVSIEAKASRARFKSNRGIDETGDISCKAASLNNEFTTNFVHLKPYLADIFVLIIVWCHDIKYMVIPNTDIPKVFTKEFREHEGQFGGHITNSNICEFNKYVVDAPYIYDSIKGFRITSPGEPTLFNQL